MAFDHAAWLRAQRKMAAVDRRLARLKARLQKAALRHSKGVNVSRRVRSFGRARASRNAGSWNRAGKIVSLLFKKHGGGLLGDRYAANAKDAEFLLSNMLGLTPKEREQEFALDRARFMAIDPGRLFIHCSLSRPASHNLTREQWIKVVNRFMRNAGLDDVNFVAIRHHNTGHDHVHIVFSRVLPGGKLRSDSHDFWTLRAAALASARELGIEIQGASEPQPQAPTDRAVSAQRRAGRRGTRDDVWVSPEIVMAALQKSSSMAQFQATLVSHGIETKMATRASDGRERGILFRKTGAQDYLAGSSISPALSLPKIQAHIARNVQEIHGSDLAINRQQAMLHQSRQRSSVPTYQRVVER